MSENTGYLRFIRDISQLAKRSSFALTGDAAYLKHDALTALRQLWQRSSQVEEERFDGGDRGTKAVQIEQSLAEFPMMGGLRLVTVENLDKVKDSKRVLEWLDQLPPETKLIASFSEEYDLPKDSAFSCVVVCNDMSVDSKEFDKYTDACLEPTKKTLLPDAREYLRTLCTDQVYLLKMELQKVSLYMGSRQQIMVTDLEKSLTLQSQTRIFDLVDAVVQRDLRTGLLLIKTVMDGGDDAISVITLITKRIGMLATIIKGLKTGERLKELMIRKKLPLFQFGRVLENLKVLKEYHIEKFYSVLCETEYRLRSWDDPRLTLENMVVELCS